MLRETRVELVQNGVRWTTNILVELLSNHGEAIGPKARDALREVVTGLANVDSALRNREIPNA